MDMLDKRMNDKGKNWRHVLKSLKVLDYCLHEGSELVVTWARKNLFIIKTLREFMYTDEEGRDVGANSTESLLRLKRMQLTVTSPAIRKGMPLCRFKMRHLSGLANCAFHCAIDHKSLITPQKP